MKIGDRVITNFPDGRKPRVGTIKGEGRSGIWWNILFDGVNKSTSSIHKSFIIPYTDPDTTQQP